MIKIWSVAFCVFTLCVTTATAGEHGGKGVEHGGKRVEHGGKRVGHSSASKTVKVTSKMIKKSMMDHINKRSKKGVFTLVDSKNKNKSYEFKFIKIHDPVRFMVKKNQYFACSDFHLKGSPEKVFDLDFWLKLEKGKLIVVKENIHKDAVQVWSKKPRYTFVGEETVPVN